ncbi:hypothetical protein, partial [Pseudomonas savastanoi]|uniref:hypothetical protein n=1 Tax=Pseudomonas savastanoi TaxID=29438 RepID=UPI000EFE7210
MKLFFKRIAIIIIIIIAAFFVARTAIISGLVKGILGTGIGRELNLILRQFFGVAGSEEDETLIISVVF